MAGWSSRGLRGSVLEELINMTIETYKTSNIALIQKIPTPIKPIKISKENRQISLAYFEKKSTVDYIGVVQGIPVCFDAKECNNSKFSLQNIHEHQLDFMNQFESQNGVAFMIVYFTKEQRTFYVRYKKIKEFFERVQDGHPKYFKIEELDLDFEIKKAARVPIHFLEQINKDLISRD